MPLKNSKRFKEKIKDAAAETNLARRGVKIASVIAEALRTIDQDPILVGGAAVEFYTEGQYATSDIDMLAPGGPELWETMKELGFERRGKDFINKELELYVEFPGYGLKEEKSDTLNIDGILLQIISREDLIVDRLASYKFWKMALDGLNALLLLEQGEWDPERLQKRARQENVLDALEWIEKIYQEIARKKLDKKEATQRLQEWLRKKHLP
ncbi:MAG: hypothetical protein Q7S98_02920 [Deltaproteobacteria bacterium]|nr:hypothetical protein [Deltaproteobacteria bacterium]